MATATKVVLKPELGAQFAVEDLSEEAAKRTSELLQENNRKHHIFFNKEGFHNHIVHHLLAIYALGAAPGTIQRQYDVNTSYQRDPQPLDDDMIEEFHDPATFKKYLNDERYFRDYLVFFQREIEKKGVGEVVNEYILKGDERANDLLGRTYAGFLHPIIHLGYGIEFDQPLVVAEGLAQAAAHDSWTGDYLLAAEQQAKKIGNPKKSSFELLEEARADKKLVESAHWDDANKIRDGILVSAEDEMLRVAGQYAVSEDDLAARTAEMINLNAYYTCAAQRPPKKVKMDFFLMHAINTSIFFPTFLEQSWLSAANKARLLEWKVRLDLALYVSRGSPDLKLEEISNYRPSKPDESDWNSLFRRITKFEDDGHASKFVRALANGEKVCRPWEEKRNFVIKGGNWLQMANMVVDSVEDTGPRWVRSTGFPQAWEQVEDRPKSQL